MINKLLFFTKAICPLFLIISCGNKPHAQGASILLNGQLTSRIPLAYLNQSGYMDSLEKYQLIFDTDGDGLIDKDDDDIDNDGVPNECDSAPFDPKIGNEDTDHNGIYDYCDFKSNDERSRMQVDIFNNFHILLVEDNLHFTLSNLKFINDVLTLFSLDKSLPDSKLKTIVLTSKLAYGEVGNYDPNWSSIRLFINNNVNWKWAFIHEYEHFYAKTHPDFFNSFTSHYISLKKNHELFYPTEYSRSDDGDNVDEYFAEYMTNIFFEKHPQLISEAL